MSILTAEHISFSYSSSGKLILNDISVTVEKGETVCLLGPNGSGKSTLLNLLCGLLTPSEGKILLDGIDLSQQSHKKIAQKIGYVPQYLNLTFDYSVMDFVMLGRTAHMNMLSLPNETDKMRVLAALEELEMIDFCDRLVKELSGGEQQKISIARALAQEPKILLFDEPTSSLDYGNQVKVLRLINKLSKENYAVIMTTHNPDHPLLLNSTTWLLGRNGHLSSAPTKDIITTENLSDLYGTDIKVIDVTDVHRKISIISL